MTNIGRELRRSTHRRIAGIAVAHALLGLATWFVTFHVQTPLIQARHWLILVWLWLLWLPVLALHPGRTLRGVLVPLGIGLLVLAPCVPTLFTFTTWSIRGFAP